MALTADFLLRGAFYALEQAGSLLHDANRLFHSGRYSSSIVLAVFALEEIGRADILFDGRKRAVMSGPVTIGFLKKQCENHAAKLQRGFQTVMFGVSRKLSRKLEVIAKAPGSPEAEDAWRRLESIEKGIRSKAPRRMHTKRLRALYVEPRAGKWNRPLDASRQECMAVLLQVGNDYGTRWARWAGPLLGSDLATTIASWVDTPQLPKPIWPTDNSE